VKMRRRSLVRKSREKRMGVGRLSLQNLKFIFRVMIDDVTLEEYE